MIVFVHLLNDRSGSPRVLHSVITVLSDSMRGDCLYIGSDGRGILEETEVNIRRYWYWRSSYRLLTLFTFLFSQVGLLFRLLFAHGIKRDALIYVNTMLPFGAALYGWMTGRPVVYHLHEVSVNPAPLKCFLTTIARLTARHLIYVSDFHYSCLPIPNVPASTIHNALDEEFFTKAKASNYQHRRDGYFNVLMIASLRDYKGIPELLTLAGRLAVQPDIRFVLVVNDDQAAIDHYMQSYSIPANLTVHPRVTDTTTFYQRASLVLNLSLVDQWVETFGMTVLEGMAYGIPVIVPPVGGPTELVQDNVQGYLVDSRDGDLLARTVLRLYDNPELCRTLSKNCKLQSENFSQEQFATALRKVLKVIY